MSENWLLRLILHISSARSKRAWWGWVSILVAVSYFNECIFFYKATLINQRWGLACLTPEGKDEPRKKVHLSRYSKTYQIVIHANLGHGNGMKTPR